MFRQVWKRFYGECWKLLGAALLCRWDMLGTVWEDSRDYSEMYSETVQDLLEVKEHAKSQKNLEPDCSTTMTGGLVYAGFWYTPETVWTRLDGPDTSSRQFVQEFGMFGEIQKIENNEFDQNVNPFKLKANALKL